MTASLRPRPDLPGAGYERPAAAVPADLWLQSNEGPAAVALSLAGAADPELLRRYPDDLPLRRELAAHFGRGSDEVVLGAGADEVLDRVCRGYLAAGRRLVAPVPCFPLLPHYTALAGGTFQGVPWRGGPPPLSALQAAAATAAVVVLTTPNNPTGLCLTTAELCTLATAAPAALCVVDLAYVEFADDDPTEALRDLPNVVVVRTFSKGYGLAGLRVGYALAAPEVAAVLRRCGSPFPCSGPSLATCRSALARGPDPAALAAVRGERTRLARRLTDLGFTCTDGRANFVFATAPARALVQALAAHLAGAGIAVRTFVGDDPLLATAVRITCPGDEGAFVRLDAALASFAAGGGA